MKSSDLASLLQRQLEQHGYHLTSDELDDVAAQLVMGLDADPLQRLLDLHASIGGAWSIEVRNGMGFSREVTLMATTVEDEHRLAETYGITLGRVFSVSGESWWSQGDAKVDGVTVRVTGPHFAVDVQPAAAPSVTTQGEQWSPSGGTP